MLAVTLSAKDVATLISASHQVIASSQNLDAQWTCHGPPTHMAKRLAIVEI
jgi:hypothetical protein